MVSEGLWVDTKREQSRGGPDHQSRSEIILRCQTTSLGERLPPNTQLEVLEQFSFFDLLREFRRCADRLEFLLRPNRDRLRLHGICARAARKQFPFQAVRELAGFRCAFVIHETAPTGVLSHAEVTLRAFEECATVEAGLRRRRVIVRGTTHQRNQLQKL